MSRCPPEGIRKGGPTNKSLNFTVTLDSPFQLLTTDLFLGFPFSDPPFGDGEQVEIQANLASPSNHPLTTVGFQTMFYL